MSKSNAKTSDGSDKPDAAGKPPQKRDAASLLLRLLSNPARSHAVSACVAVVLSSLVAWIWIYPETLSADRSHTKTQIDDAVNLINNGGALRLRFQKADEQHRQFEARINEISEWLPEKRTFESIRSELQSLASRADVQLIALDRGNTNVGTRVAVLNTRLEIQGSYKDICRFVKELAELDAPIWCDEVRIVRGNQFRDDDDGHAAANQVKCLATLSLRAPYAGGETTGGKLLLRRNHNAT